MKPDTRYSAIIRLQWYILILTFFFAFTINGQQPFITTWKTDNPGVSGNTSITIPTTGTGYNYNVDWNNDGTFDQLGITGDVTHDFMIAGTYTIRISGMFPRIYFNWSGDCNKILTINQWGTITWTSMERAFYGCGNLTSIATDTPNLSGVTDLSYMFSNAVSFNGNIGNWNVSTIVNMSNMFANANSFNQDINSWNVSLVNNMNRMFYFAISFNKSLNNWNVSNVINMTEMFHGAMSFNQNLNSWNVSNVITMYAMFSNAVNFNQDISTWNVGRVQNMGYMFQNAYLFNQNIGNWNVSMVWNMWSMFTGASSFNQNIGNWNVTNVIDMYAMFQGAISFNQNIGNWNVSNVTLMGYMFSNASSFNQDISNWNVSRVTNMGDMFYNAISFNQDIGNWNVANVTNMYGMFKNANSFNQDLPLWTLNNAVNLQAMFDNSGISCENYDNTLIGWNTNIFTPNNRILGAVGRLYWQALSARNNLVNNKGWTIQGDSYSNCNYPLPVDLLYFDASLTDQRLVELNWQTANEINNNGFELQRSTDGRSWEKIGFIDPVNQNSNINNYHSIDHNPKNHSNYYRLMQKDVDGNVKYSNIEHIFLSIQEEIKIFPVPSLGTITIEGLEEGKIKIIDGMGRTVKAVVSNTENIDISELPEGIYLIQIEKEGQFISKKIFKK